MVVGNTKYKKTKVGLVPDEWEVVSLENILANQKYAMVDGPFGSNLKNSHYVENGIPVLQGKNITGNKFEWKEVRFITYEKAQELARSRVRFGDILMVKIGSIGYSALLDDLSGFDYAIIPANLLKITIDEKKYSKSFLLQFLCYAETVKRLQKLASQTAQPALSLKAVKKLPIIKPPLIEQSKIAEILSTVDDAIEKTDAIIKETQQLKKGVIEKLFTEGIGHKRFKETKIGRIPEEWDVKTVGSIGIVKGGKRLPKGKKLIDNKTSYPYIRVINFKNMTVDTQGLKYLTEEVQKKISRYIIDKDDVYISIAGTIGLSGIIPNDLDGANLTENAAKITNLKGVDKLFLAYYLNSTTAQKQIKSFTGVVSQPKLALYRIEKINVSIPNLTEQKNITAIFNNIDRKLENEQNYKSELEQLKKGLLQVLLTGKVRVKV